jgi:hypothetical protein
MNVKEVEAGRTLCDCALCDRLMSVKKATDSQLR